MNEQKQQVVEKLKAANNVLVTVSTNPSVDQLAACIGLTLLLNKMGKHATAVFSGTVPSTIEFLKPEETLEKNTDSLRDFIIAIDKNKADKLRYKVEDEVVKIFITPYKHAIDQKDLIYSQGDFNVDVVLALGVTKQQDIDAAILAHGRILHDAVVVSVDTAETTSLGTLSWLDKAASGMSELSSALAVDLAKDMLDKQISTALLTGIVAETDHFGNQKTTPQTMTISAALLAAGANQQLVATQLGHSISSAAPISPVGQDSNQKNSHNDKSNKQSPKSQKGGTDRAAADAVKSADTSGDAAAAEASSKADKPDEAPAEDSLEAVLSQAAEEEGEVPVSLNLPAPTASPMSDMPPFEAMPTEPAPSSPVDEVPKAELSSIEDLLKDSGTETLDQIEHDVHSPHLEDTTSSGDTLPVNDDGLAKGDSSSLPPSEPAADEVDSARKAVEDALQGAGAEATSPDEPLEAINAVPIDLNLDNDATLIDASPADTVAASSPVSAVPAAPTTAFTPEAFGLTPDSTDETPLTPPPIPPAPAVLPDYLTTPSVSPAAPVLSPTPPPLSPVPNPVLPHNPAVNEQAPLQGSPADQPVTMQLPPAGSMQQPAPGFQVPPPQTMPPTTPGIPPQGPPPPPAPPPLPTISHHF